MCFSFTRISANVYEGQYIIALGLYLHFQDEWIHSISLPMRTKSHFYTIICDLVFGGRDQRVGKAWKPYRQMEKAHVRVPSYVISLFSDCVTGHLKTHFFHVVSQ